MRRISEYIVLAVATVIFGVYHAVLTSLVIAATDNTNLGYAYIFWVEMVAVLPVVVYMFAVIWLSKIKPKFITSFGYKNVLLHIFIAMLLFAIHAVWQSFANSVFFEIDFTLERIQNDFMGFLIMRFFLYIIIIGLVGGMVNLRKNREEASKVSKLNLELQQAKQRELELKLNPEIIYPNLAYIKQNAATNADLASQMVIIMAGLLRKLVDNLESDMIKISDDIQFFKLYIQMLSLRLERSLEVIVEKNETPDSFGLPSMILIIPLLEELFFGKYKGALTNVKTICYCVDKIDAENSAVSVVFKQVKSQSSAFDTLEVEPNVQSINNKLKGFINTKYNFSTILRNGDLHLVLTIKKSMDVEANV